MGYTIRMLGTGIAGWLLAAALWLWGAWLWGGDPSVVVDSARQIELTTNGYRGQVIRIMLIKPNTFR
jgi:hypothetical protein